MSVMRKFVSTGLLLLCAVAGVTSPLHAQTGRTETVQFQHGGYARSYLVHVPPGYDGKTLVPLVLSFHGRHGQGKDQATLTHLDKVSDQHGFIVVYPDGVEKSWNALHGTGGAEALGVDDVGFVDALLTSLTGRYTIDPKRIYASGMSNGGFLTHRLGCELSDRFAAIASVAGLMSPAMASVCGPSEPQPVLVIHGTWDPIVPFNGGDTAGGGTSLSAIDTVDVWRRKNQCKTRSTETFRKGQVVCRSYQGCEAPVTLCAVDRAGHTWPGGEQYLSRLLIGTTNTDIDASEMIWQFFAANPKR